MASENGLWFGFNGDRLADKIEHAIQENDFFTSVVISSSVSLKVAELAIVSLNGEMLDFLGIAKSGRRVATDQKTVSVSNFVRLEGVDLESIEKQLPTRLRNHFRFPTEGVYRPTSKMWSAFLDLVTTAAPASKKRLTTLRTLIGAARLEVGRREGGLEVFERDAVATALETFGGRNFRKRILRGAASASDQTATAPFLAKLREVPLREDPQIVHDQTTFPGMEVVRRYQVDAVVLANRDERLTIVNCNRQPLEKTLGVDLIYYNHHHDSFVLVQYKRMAQEKKSGKAAYRPITDANHEPELQRMKEAQLILDAAVADRKPRLQDYRLSARPFYMKLCEPKAKAALDSNMVSGMYLPVGLWRRLLRSKSVQGTKGGIVITWENCTRRFNNSEFTSLLRQGWIGSANGQSKLLSEIVETVLKSGRMIVFAASSEGTNVGDYRRDEAGRFASDADPLASN